MAIILRITSADGRKVMTKALPALPSTVKIPVGGRADVIDPETKQEVTLARWINDHSADRQRSNNDHPEQGRDYVKMETVDWEAAESWFAALPAAPGAPMAQADNWYAATEADGDRELLGLDLSTILIGTAVGGAAAFGVYELTKSDRPKDRIAPAAPAGLDLAAADDTGSSSTDNVTRTTTGLTISGTAEAGSKVELFDGTTSLGTVDVGASGTFTKDIDLAAGPHAITARATDLAGNVSANATPLIISVDTIASAVPNTLALAAADDTGASTTDGVTRNFTALTITGKADPGAVVELFDGTTSVGTVTAGTDGNFTRDLTLLEGSHVITAKSTDAAGNASDASSALTILVDVTAPAKVTLDLAAADDNGASNTDNITSQRDNLTISGVAEAGSVVQLFDGTTTAFATTTAAADGTYSIDVALSIGVHNLTARATDLAGNVSVPSDILGITILADAPASLGIVDSNTSLIG